MNDWNEDQNRKSYAEDDGPIYYDHKADFWDWVFILFIVIGIGAMACGPAMLIFF